MNDTDQWGAAQRESKGRGHTPIFTSVSSPDPLVFGGRLELLRSVSASGQEGLAHLVLLGTSASVMELQTSLKNTLKNKYQQLNEAYSKNALLPSRLCYRNLNRDYQFPNLDQQEFRYVENADLHTFKTVPLTDILSCDCKHKSRKRTVITLGVCGVGKSTTVQSCALEWAEGKGYRDIQLLFPLTFWELNLVKRLLNMIELLQTFFPGLKELDASSLNRKNVWFVLDGLDEYHCALKFNCPTVSDVSQVSTVQVLVTNLIRGTLLPNAHVWVTTGYAAAAQIPADYLLKETQVQGFSDDQKEQNFRTIIGNDDLANRAIDHVKISKSLDCLCQIPPICTIMANVLKSHLKEDQGFKFSPLNLTQIYTILVKTSKLDIFAKLKRLALCRMHKENLIYEDDLLKSDISAEEASSFSKECPLVLREEKGLHNTTVFRFGQSSIRDFLGAGATLDEIQIRIKTLGGISDNFEMDVSTRCDQRLLRQLPAIMKSRRAMLRFSNLTDKCCPALAAVLSTRESYLRELDLGYNSITDSGVGTLVEGLNDQYCRLKTLRLQGCEVTPRGCKHLATALTQSLKLRELDLSRNEIGDDGLRHLSDGLRAPECQLETLKLSQCNIEQMGCYHLASALHANPDYLTALDLSINMVGDEGANELFKKFDISKLQKLEMYHCGLTVVSCGSIGEALKSEDSSLVELNLSNNTLKDSGFALICEGMYAWCSLEKLNLSHCNLTDECCTELAVGFMSKESIISEVDLSENDLQDKGVRKLCVGLRNPQCKLEKLSLRSCGLTSKTIQFLISALRSNPRYLAELHLMGNSLEDSGIRLLLDLTTNDRYALHIIDRFAD
ncbi:hypothetical protein F2P81_010724 [Scophthalmus maximus]|uniref:NACHT domain-containing protein n=1 Tax=Scophthalmus maximus TaxID=52904 RepID=A0A6A4T1E9_SCOMX|nr:hypothetical protein F2P81_010724 [Scophthalmus maximus]